METAAEVPGGHGQLHMHERVAVAGGEPGGETAVAFAYESGLVTPGR